MRTTLTLDDDVFEVARTLAQTTKRSLSKIVSDLMGRGLEPQAAPDLPADKRSDFLACQGQIKVGPGSVVEDVALARQLARVFSGPGARDALAKLAATPRQHNMAKIEAAILDSFSLVTPRVLALCQDGQRQAQGFLITSAGEVVTAMGNRSEKRDFQSLEVLHGGENRNVKVVHVNRGHNFALLEVQLDRVGFAKLEYHDKPAPIGETVIAIVLGRDGSPGLRVGRVIDLDNQKDIVGAPELVHRQNCFAANLEVESSEMGAPVFDKNGHLLGLVVCRNHAGNIAIVLSAGIVMRIARAGGSERA